MNFAIKNNKNKNGLIKIVAGIVCLVLLVVILSLAGNKIRNFVYTFSSPVLKVFSNSGNNTAGILGAILNSGNLKNENGSLKIENQKLLAQMSSLQDISSQDQAVKDILNCSQQDGFKLLLSNITGFDPSQDFLLIDKGKDDGISENMALISQEKVLFGKIFRVYKNYSQVMLISNKNSVLDVKIQKNDATLPPVYGAVKGKGGLSVYLDLVPTDLEINSQDVLITSALEGIFPKDLLVGKIIGKTKNDLKPFQTASIAPFFDVKKTDKLFVITNYMKTK